MRYFRTSNASRRYRAGDLAFTFEPMENVGGSWTGSLAVEDDAAAVKIAAAAIGIPQITEITAEEYEALKKKPKTPPVGFRELTSPPPSNGFPVAADAGRVPSTLSNRSTPAPAPPAPAQPMAAIKTAKVEPPDELKVADGVPRRRR